MSVRSSLKFLLCQCLRTLTSLYNMIPRQGFFCLGCFPPWVYVAQEVWINLAVNWFYKNYLDSEGKRRAWSRQYRMWGPFNHIWQGVQMKHYSEKIKLFTLLQSSVNRGTLVRVNLKGWPGANQWLESLSSRWSSFLLPWFSPLLGLMPPAISWSRSKKKSLAPFSGRYCWNICRLGVSSPSSFAQAIWPT